MQRLTATSKDAHPLFVAAGAPGVGKSRILDEGLTALTAVATADSDATLSAHLEHSADVRVTFNSYSQLSPEDDGALGGDGIVALCARMLYVVFAHGVPTRDGTVDKWDLFRELILHSPGHERLRLRTVLQVIHLALGEPAQWCVYLAVDEAARLCSLPPKKEHSPVKVAGVSVAARDANHSLEVVIGELGKNMCDPERGLLFIPFLAGQSVIGLRHAFRGSFYTPKFVDCSLLSFDEMYKALDVGPGIQVRDWQTDAGFVRAVADMGGNMRALEYFIFHAEELAKPLDSHSARDISLVIAYRRTLDGLNDRYDLPVDAVCFELVRHAVLRLGVRRKTLVPNMPASSTLTFGDLESEGHVSIRNGYLQLPFVHFFRMVEHLRTVNPYANCFVSLELKLEDDLATWQSWEDFNVRYDALRLSLYALDADMVCAKEFFRGARLAPGLERVHLPLPRGALFRTAYSSQHFKGAKSTGLLVPKVGSDMIDWKAGCVVVRNGDGAPWADWFTFFPEPSSKPALNPGHKLFTGHVTGQGKFSVSRGPTPLSDSDVAAEAAKVTTDCGGLIFGLFTNAKVEKPVGGLLPPDQVLVSQEEFNDYYGPVFAMRATFAFVNPDSVPINTAPLHQLTMVPNIGDASARAIIEERRAGGPFANAEAVLDRVQLARGKKIEKLSLIFFRYK